MDNCILLITYVIYYKAHGNVNVFPISCVLYLLRRNGVSKYAIWIVAFMLHNKYYTPLNV